jgi:hypothetical protein
MGNALIYSERALDSRAKKNRPRKAAGFSMADEED